MSSSSPDAHVSDPMAGPHGAGDHDEDHGHDDHAHPDDEPLGPVDLLAWGAGVLGIGAGLVVALVIAASTGWLG